MYLIKQVSEISGVSVRTLHHYDEIGLLSPKKHENGYRYYSEEELSLLQTILYYKYLGFSLKDIKNLMKQEEEDLLPHLKHQLILMQKEKERLLTLIDTLEKTIESKERKMTMTTEEKFKGFTFKDNEKYKNKKVITFDLLSDIVLPFNQVKNIGEEIKVLFGNELREKLELSMKKTFVNVEKLEGYSIVNNFRKNDEIIIKSGSVLTYLINENDLESVLERLVEIEIKGLGLRKNEGFGKVRICSKRERSS